MRFIFGSINCARPLGLIERDIRMSSMEFANISFPSWRDRPTMREILIESTKEQPTTYELDTCSRYAFLPILSYPPMIGVWQKRYANVDKNVTCMLIAIGSGYFCAVHMVCASIFVEPEQRETLGRLIMAHESATAGDALWFDSEHPGQVFRRSLTIFEDA